ncbi:MAG: hypothetical protein Q8916_06550 [Bacteroidota bacterium]|nr:hypothetical protein [Bacteroidota bacterium]MDP4230050.1 hypothetical protein [Bacteroidota bacterium]MDP4236042.1 hypothetical protein [Bacteroidota bacterium]
MTNDLISVIANLALALSFLVALVFGITQVHSAARDRRERLTLETIRNFQSREFAELLYQLTNRQMPATQAEFQSLPQNEQVIFIQFAQQMEHLGILVADKVIDVDLVDKTLGSFVMTSWEKYKPMFLNMRIKLPDPYLGEYFQWLAERIDKRMTEKPRPPVYEQKL